MIIWPPKPPTAVEVYEFEFSGFLAVGETIASAVIVADGVTAAPPVISGTQVQVRLSGGTSGTVAKVVGTIVTSLGATWPETAVIEINGEVIALATAKMAQRIDGSDEDALLAGFLRAAIGHVETRTGKNLTQKIVSQTADGFPGGYRNTPVAAPGLVCGGAATGTQAIRLWKGPVSEILSVKYDDSDGVEQALTSFRLVEAGASGSARLLPAYGEPWPVTAVGPGAVRISYVAGYDPTELPPELTLAATLLFGHYNANREAVMADTRAAAVELPLGVEALISPYCVPGIA